MGTSTGRQRPSLPTCHPESLFNKHPALEWTGLKPGRTDSNAQDQGLFL